MRLRLLRLLRRQRPIVEQLLERQNPAAPLILERQGPTVPQLLWRQKPTLLLISERWSPAVQNMPFSIQQSHAEGMQCLETEAMKEDGTGCLSLLTTLEWHCRPAPRRPSGTNGPPPFTKGEHVLGYSSKHSPSGVFHRGGINPCDSPCYYSSSIQALPQGPNNDTICPTRWCPCHGQEMKLWGLSKYHPT